MASTYSPNLRLELIGTGEQQGTWGNTTNTNLGTLLEEAIGGYTSVTVSNLGDTTLTTNNGAADQSRNMVINLTGTISANRNVICPAIEKLYVVKNATTGGFSVTFKVSGQTGVTIPNGETYFLYVNGTDANTIVGNVASTNATNTFTENQIIEVTDNTDAALRITQLGTGNALLVEDSANPDSNPTVINASGGIVVGTTSAIATDNWDGTQITPKVQVHATTNENSSIASTNWQSNANPSQIVFSKSRSGIVGTRGVVQSGDNIGAVSFAGDDGATFVSAASVVAAVDGTPGTNDMPGRLVFSTTADGDSAPTERMRINSVGNVNIGAADDPESALQITGNTNPTGVMVGSISGTTLTITAVTSGSISVGDRLFIATSGLDYNTYVTALGTGTGGTGTYTINNTTTLASTTIYFYASRINTLSFVDNDTTEFVNQPIGGIEWYSSDASTPGAGVKAYVAAIAESATPDSALIFGTSDNVASTQAVEAMRITSGGDVGIGTKTPATKFDVNGAATLSAATTENRYIKVGYGRTGNGYAYIDLTGDATYTTYGARFIRNNTGPNTTSQILHRGTGNLEVTTVDAAPIVFSTNSTEAARLTTSNQLLIGTATARTLEGAIPALQLSGTTESAASLSGTVWSTTAGTESNLYLSKGYSLTAGTFTATASGQNMGGIRFAASDGSAFAQGSVILAETANTWSTTSNPTDLSFYTCATGSNTVSRRVTIKDSGNVGVGTAAPDALLSVNGVASFGDGSTALPSISHFGDLNTGISFPSADTITFSTGGTQAFRIRSDQNVIFGSSTGSATVFANFNNAGITGSTSMIGINSAGTILSDVTSAYKAVTATPATNASAFTISNVYGFWTDGVSKGSGSTITTQYGFYVDSALTAAGTNYGYYGNIASATGRWNFYAGGTAPNYFEGDARVAGTFTQYTNPINSNIAATLTATGIKSGIYTSTPTADINFTLPTGTNIDSSLQDIQTGQSFEWSVINLAASGSGFDVTVVANTNHTVVGNMVVTPASSGRFLTRRTSTANTYVTYRIG